jgi:hypothetical protein
MSLTEPLYSPLAVHVYTVLASVFALLILLVLYWSGGGELTSRIGRQLTSLIGGQLSSGTSGTKETTFTSSTVVFGLMLTLREYSKLTASTSISSFIEISCGLLGSSQESSSLLDVFDTGASLHIPDSTSHMRNLQPNAHYSIVGVHGRGTCKEIGHPDMHFMGEHEVTGAAAMVRLRGDERTNANALCVPASPATPISWNEMKRAGWKLSPDGDYVLLPEARVRIVFGNLNGLLTMPLVTTKEGSTNALQERRTGSLQCAAPSPPSSPRGRTEAPAPPRERERSRDDIPR